MLVELYSELTLFYFIFLLLTALFFLIRWNSMKISSLALWLYGMYRCRRVTKMCPLLESFFSFFSTSSVALLLASCNFFARE